MRSCSVCRYAITASVSAVLMSSPPSFASSLCRLAGRDYRLRVATAVLAARLIGAVLAGARAAAARFAVGDLPGTVLSLGFDFVAAADVGAVAGSAFLSVAGCPVLRMPR